MQTKSKPRFARGSALTMAWLSAVVSLGCSKAPASERQTPKPSGSAPSAATSSANPAPKNAPSVLGSERLTAEELQRFYHLAEGSEFVPYCALELFAKESGRTIEQYFERYHLIADAKSASNPLGLPIGVTVASGPSKLVGFNCAACHVGKIPAENPLTVVGAPASFNIRQFYDDLVPWLSSLAHDGKRLRAVAGCMLIGAKALPNSSQPKDRKAADKVADELEASLAEEFKKSKGLLTARLHALDQVKAVGAVKPTTLPGPGRVDAFMTALNLLNPQAKLAMNSPVAFPQLWNVGKLKWLHWDNNTNAVLQRNMGQAVGVGALLASDPGDPKQVIATTLQVPALLELETIMKKLQAPRWPFEASSRASVDAGEPIFKAQCARCHQPNADGSMPDPSPSDSVGTDPFRLKNFEQKWHDKKLIDVLAEQLAAIERAANPPVRDPSPRWIATGQYGARSLQGVWATAPYLHNNSVPTLADLLKVPGERPAKFALDYSRYDRENVGFVVTTSPSDTSPLFDTAQDGNGNGGHTYGTELNQQEKLDLLAYLKSL